jgi:hypothetical protein
MAFDSWIFLLEWSGDRRCILDKQCVAIVKFRYPQAIARLQIFLLQGDVFDGRSSAYEFGKYCGVVCLLCVVGLYGPTFQNQ